MKRSGPWLALIAGLSCAGAGCACSGEAFSTPSGAAGSPAGGAGGGPSGGLQADRTLNTLNSAEQNQLCSELRAQVDATTNSDHYRSVLCTISSWTSSNDALPAMRVTQCQSLYDQCLVTTDNQLSDNVQCNEIVPLNAACTTVGLLRQCYRAWGPGIQQTYADAFQGQPTNCVEAFQNGGVNANPVQAESDAPPECVDIVLNCNM